MEESPKKRLAKIYVLHVKGRRHKTSIQLDVGPDIFKAPCEKISKIVYSRNRIHKDPSTLAEVYVPEAFSPPRQNYTNRKSNHRATLPLQAVTYEFARGIPVREFTAPGR